MEERKISGEWKIERSGEKLDRKNSRECKIERSVENVRLKDQ